jgi:transcriptional regulator of acetoin/glycerol metabolism
MLSPPMTSRPRTYHGSKVKTAESLGMSRATIYRKIHQYGIITPAS